MTTQQTGDTAPAAITVAEAHARWSGGTAVVDVRESEEYARGHVPGAVNIPLGQIGARIAQLPGSGELLLICGGGGRSAKAQRIVAQSGRPGSLSVSGGTRGWIAAGYPVDQG